MVFVIGKNVELVGAVGAVVLLLQMIPPVGAIFPTERALANRFG